MNLWEMSVSGGILILVVILIRSLFWQKLPEKAFQVLWFLVLIRLLIPFAIPCKLSIYSVMEKQVTVAGDEYGIDIVEKELGADPKEYGMIDTLNKTRDMGMVIEEREKGEIFGWKYLYLVGVLVCAGYYLFSYIRWRREFQTSLPIEDHIVQKWATTLPIQRKVSVRQWDRTTTPFTYGIAHPVILLPKALEREKPDYLKFVLLHEYMHIRHFDTVKKILLILACCIHWFNPLVWVMSILANRDLELACDENVIKYFGRDMRASYALALISMEEQKSMGVAWANSFNKNAMEERIVAIMKEKKVSILACVLACVFTAGVVLVFATSTFAENRVTQESYAEYEGDIVERQRYSTREGLSYQTEDFEESSGTVQQVESGYGRAEETFTNELVGSAYVVNQTSDTAENIAQVQGEGNKTYEVANGAFVDGYVIEVPKEYRDWGLTANAKTGGWEYNGKHVAILYDEGIYTFADGEKEKNFVYLEVCRDSKGKINSIRERDKKQIQKLLKKTGLMIE